MLWAWNRLPLNTYISMYARTNRCYNKRGSRTIYVHSSIPHCINEHRLLSFRIYMSDTDVTSTFDWRYRKWCVVYYIYYIHFQITEELSLHWHLLFQLLVTVNAGSLHGLQFPLHQMPKIANIIYAWKFAVYSE